MYERRRVALGTEVQIAPGLDERPRCSVPLLFLREEPRVRARKAYCPARQDGLHRYQAIRSRVAARVDSGTRQECYRFGVHG